MVHALICWIFPQGDRQLAELTDVAADCQMGVSLEIATATQHAPIDFELYLPESWTKDPERRAKADISEELTFKTNVELALGMIERAARAESYPSAAASAREAAANTLRRFELPRSVHHRHRTRPRASNPSATAN